MITLYARQEPTTDETTRQLWPETKAKDTVFYRDADCSDLVARIPWHHRNRPVRRKTVTLNCFTYSIEWV